MNQLIHVDVVNRRQPPKLATGRTQKSGVDKLANVVISLVIRDLAGQLLIGIV